MKHICVQKTRRMMRGMPGLLTASHVLVNLPSAEVFSQHTLPQTVSLHLKIDAWKIGISFWGFQGTLAVSFRDDYMVNMLLSLWPTQSR